uniref:acyltransferase family protein n=1 Tax=Shewanella marina TaxID=487319 RepID=UPI0011DD4172
MLISIQVMRGFAAILVVFYHIYYISKLYSDYNIRHFELLHLGVDIFFILSGFIMVYIINKGDSFSNNMILKFLKDRIIRIVPLYWFFTIVMFLSYIFIFDKEKSIIELLKSLFFIPYYDSFSFGIYPILGVGWTLNYEMYFYFLIIISIYLFRSNYFKPLVLSMVLISVFGYFIIDDNTISNNPFIYTYFNHYLLEFCIGLII